MKPGMKPFLTAVAGLTLGLAAMVAVPALTQPAGQQAVPQTAQQGGRGEQAGNAGASSLQDRSARSPAERLYVEKCSMCHRQFGMGTMTLARRVDKGQEMLEARDDLTADQVRFVVRNGIGNMPRVPRGELSDAQLEIIAAYLSKGKAE